MSKRDWIGTFAAGLIAGALLAGQFFALSQWLGSNAPADIPPNEQRYSKNQNSPGNITPTIASVSDFNPWEDSVAQWAMAIFAFAATGVSIWAIVLLKKTLLATEKGADFAKETVAVTREIGEAQTRAYLFVDKAKYKISKTAFVVSIEIGNAGQSPANNVYISGDMYLHCVAGFRDNPRVISMLPSSRSETICAPIGIGSRSIETLHFFKDINFGIEEGFGLEVDGELFDIFNQIGFNLDVGWEDVFGKEHKFSVDLFADFAATPTNPSKKRSSAGALIVRTEGNY